MISQHLQTVTFPEGASRQPLSMGTAPNGDRTGVVLTSRSRHVEVVGVDIAGFSRTVNFEFFKIIPLTKLLSLMCQGFRGASQTYYNLSPTLRKDD